SKEFKELIKAEVNALLSQQYSLSYQEINLSEVATPSNAIIQSIFQDDSDILITLGFRSSGLLQAAGTYPKPSLAGISLERTNKVNSGIPNYTYIQSPFSIERDLAAFQAIRPFQHLGIFLPKDMESSLQTYLNAFSNGIDIQFIPISNDPMADLNQLNENVDAIYILPNLYNSEADFQALIDGINARKLPSFSLIGRNDVEKGVLASISPSDYVNVYARRIAINVMKILEGQKAEDLPIQISGIEDDFVINVATMEQLEVYPPFEVLGKATLINLEPRVGNQYTLQSAVAEALTNNLNLQAASKDVDAQQTEIGIANANLLPNLEASSTFVTIDGISAEFLKAANQITPQTQWTGNLGLTQLVFSQPALANVAIQKALLYSEEAGLLSQQLDLVLSVCEAYIGILQAQANVNIQNTNVQTTLSNLNIAKNKAKIGAVSNADVYGFESQLALNRSSLNDAFTLVEQAKINFNQLLNKPLDEEILLEDIQDKDDLLFLYDERIFERVNNYYDFREFSAFLTNYALKHAPELDQLALREASCALIAHAN
ncbi:MAG: ABC transporter substrate binding protein, partial [Bacteroidota bacterium]